MAKDLAQFILETLQADSDFTDLVTGGDTNILSTGDMRVAVLATAEDTRRTAGNSLVLGVSVQDAGESHSRGPLWIQTAVVRGLDRLNGYDAIRNIRFQAVTSLNGKTGVLDEGGIVQISYRGRTGHRVDRVYNVDFEGLTFTAVVDKSKEA